MLNEALSLGGMEVLGPKCIGDSGEEKSQRDTGKGTIEDLSARRCLRCFMLDVTSDLHSNPLP